MTKQFPKSRICVIDAYPPFEEGIKSAFHFARNYNVDLNSADGKKIILSFCLKSIDEHFKNTKSSFPKVYCMNKKTINNKLEKFVNLYFEKIINFLPVPYCGKFDFNSPDLEFAAESCLNKQQKPKHKFEQFVANIKMKK